METWAMNFTCRFLRPVKSSRAYSVCSQIVVQEGKIIAAAALHLLENLPHRYLPHPMTINPGN